MSVRSEAAAVDTADAAWLSTLLSGLVGTQISLDVAAGEALAEGTVKLGSLEQILGGGGGLDQALTLAQWVMTLGAAAALDGDDVTAQVLTTLAGQLASVTGAVRPSDVLDVLHGVSPDLTLPLRDLVVNAFAAWQLAHDTSADAIDLSASLLADVDAFDAASAKVWVVESGRTVVGGAGAVARSPHLRVQLLLTPVDLDTAVSGVGGLGTISLALEPIAVVLDIAASTATITSVSETNVTVSAQPGVVTAYLGSVTPSAFEDRTSTIDPETDLLAAPVATLDITLLGSLLMGHASVLARATADASPEPTPLVIDPPYAATATAAANLGFLDTLIADLLSDLDVQVTSYTQLLGLTLSNQMVVADAVTDLLRGGLSPLVAILDDAVAGLTGPLLDGLGARIGGVDVTVSGFQTETDGIACGDGTCRASACCTGCWNGSACIGGTEADACGRGGAACASCDDGLACTSDACTEQACASSATSGCAIAGQCLATGDVSAANACQVCTPSRSTSRWSAAPRSECLVDTDGDGIPDVEEDVNGNGNLDDDDSDGDGIPDYLDPDDSLPPDANDEFAVRGGALCAVTAPGIPARAPTWLGLFAALGLLAHVRMRRRFLAATAAASVSALGVNDATAQPMMNVERYDLPVTPNGALAVSDTTTLGHLHYSGTLSLDYARAPLVLERVDMHGNHQVVGAIVEHQLFGQLAFALGLGTRSLVYLRLPFAPVLRGDDTLAALPAGTPTSGSAALGDLALGARVRFFGEDDGPFTLGGQLTLTLPTAVGSRYVGERTVSAHPELLLRARASVLTIRANVGVRIRKPTEIVNLELGSELTFGAGFAVLVYDGAKDLTLHADLFGSASFEGFGARGSIPAELLMGASVRGDRGVSGGFGVGPGVSRGYGTPDVRALAMISYARREPEPIAAPPACAAGPEDLDGFEDDDGCAEPDNDSDALIDSADACPTEAEDMDGFEDANGCPDPDNDSDGVLDAADACPNDAEDADGFQDTDGCPDPDNDGDGILDAADACPNTAEDRDGIRDEDGCPETDADDDGILDTADRCPLERESRNGVDDEDGCPDHIRVDLSQGRIMVMEPVYFAPNSDRILSRSFPMLDEIADLLVHRDELGRIAVEGHTDDRGPDSHNLALSQRRADAVVRYLVEHHVAAPRLEAHGYGETRPVAPNGSLADRARNRRVEFNILGPDGTQTVTADPEGEPRR